MRPGNIALLNAAENSIRSWTALAFIAGFALAGAIASQTALAQTLTSPLPIAFQEGEWSKSYPASRQYSGPVYFSVSHPPIICGFHSTDDLKLKIADLIKDGMLQSKLDALEIAGESTAEQLAAALESFTKSATDVFARYHTRPLYNRNLFGYAVTASQYNNVLAGNSHEMKTENCLPFADAKAWTLELRKVVRAYLTLSPPQ